MRRLDPYLYATPALIVLVTFVYWPIIYSGWLSLHHFDFLMPEPRFIGLDNYRTLLDQSQFQNAVNNTLIFTIVSVPPKLALALLLATLIAPASRSNRLLRSLYFMPVVLSSVAIGIVFDLMMNTELGSFNRLLGIFGVSPIHWLTDPNLALLSIAAVDVWKSFGYDVVIYAAALQALPTSLMEAARMDGANAWQRFRDITFPLIMPTTFFLMLLSVINSFQVFTFVDVMTEGGPARATEVVVYYLVRTGFSASRIGLASAVAILLFIVLLAITALKFASIGRKVHYGYR